MIKVRFVQQRPFRRMSRVFNATRRYCKRVSNTNINEIFNNIVSHADGIRTSHIDAKSFELFVLQFLRKISTDFHISVCFYQL